MKEQGWIIAAKRHDAGAPSIVKAFGSEVAADLYHEAEDAARKLEQIEQAGQFERGVLAVFPVHSTVLSLRGAGTDVVCRHEKRCHTRAQCSAVKASSGETNHDAADTIVEVLKGLSQDRRQEMMSLVNRSFCRDCLRELKDGDVCFCHPGYDE